jgi:hypothetical protein
MSLKARHDERSHTPLPVKKAYVHICVLRPVDRTNPKVALSMQANVRPDAGISLGHSVTRKLHDGETHLVRHVLQHLAGHRWEAAGFSDYADCRHVQPVLVGQSLSVGDYVYGKSAMEHATGYYAVRRLAPHPLRNGAITNYLYLEMNRRNEDASLRLKVSCVFHGLVSSIAIRDSKATGYV